MSLDLQDDQPLPMSCSAPALSQSIRAWHPLLKVQVRQVENQASLTLDAASNNASMSRNQMRIRVHANVRSWGEPDTPG
jgi:hypothetical protein